MIPVILSGGSGTRLWPVSRAKLPKQFCQIFQNSLQSMTIQRLNSFGKPWIVTSKTLKDLTLRECNNLDVPSSQILLEPLPKNTAPAIAWLCYTFLKKGLSDAIVGIFPADHLIEDEVSFHQALQESAKVASEGRIVTLGIQPTFPSTGYGYIQVPKSEDQKRIAMAQALSVLRFHEKPSLTLATEFINAKNYFWNAGIFIFKIKTMVSAFERLAPEIWNEIKKLGENGDPLESVYSRFPNISIDYAIMEKLSESELSCVPCECGWSDVGSWDAIMERMNEEKSNIFEADAHGNRVFSRENRSYAFIDTDDLIVVDTADALLISKKGSTQKVKEIYDQLKSRNPQLASEHRNEIRPWGQFEILKDDTHYKSKVIEVLPHSQLSYQSHTQREEHWIITRGQGEVVLNDKVIPVKKGTYVHIPQGSKHRMRNTSSEVLEFIEVQLGSYFGEDDIIRYQDDYLRT